MTNTILARFGVGVKVWPLTNTQRSLTHTGAEVVVVPCDAVEDAAVVPDS